MSRIFISHSSRDDLEAVALRDWLAAEGWDDVFLDFDPNRGIVAGQSWERRLNEAASRCEAVVFLVSANWLASGWCLKEYTTARRLNKKLFAVLIDPDKPVGELPPELTDTWQVTDLAGGTDKALLRAVRPGTQQEKQVGFNRDGLTRLKRGLEKAGLDPRFFAWPPEDEPERAPFRGLKPLEAGDAGIFFGRDAPIVEAADRLRGLGFGAPPRLMVLLGASGAGKSSFLRAGLLPRLARDDRHFVCLPPIRPERAAITGENGLLHALRAVCAGCTPAAIASAVDAGAAGMRPLLAELVQTVFQRTLAEDDASGRPTVVIAIDQAEELFRAEGAQEARALLGLLRGLTSCDDPVAVVVIFAIRSDSYDALEHARELEGLRQETMPLLPMPRGAYKDVIEGPIRRVSEIGGKLSIEPQLTARLMDDIDKGAGSDALPLLAFTLEQLYLAQGNAGTLRLAAYEAAGGLGGAIDAAVERAFARADADPGIPRDRTQREALLRRGLIPWLAGIDPDTRSPRRNIARLADLPTETTRLVALLVEERLLSIDTVRTVDADAGTATQIATIEPTHEALLRQWGLLAGWLAEDFAVLATLEGVQRASRDWAANGGDPAWLAHGGGRLAEAQALDSRPDIAAKLGATDRAYVTACRNREEAIRVELEQRRREREEEQERRVADAQALAAATRRTAQRTRIGLVAALVLAVAAVGFGLFARTQKTIADQKTIEAEHQTDNARQAAAEATRQKNIATTQEKQAQTEKARADDSAATATRNAGLAEERLRASQRSESLSLAEQSLRETETGDTRNAIKLALKALPADPERPERPLASRALFALERAVWSHRLRLDIKAGGTVEGVQYTPDGGKLLVSGRDGTLSLLDAGSAAPIWKVEEKRRSTLASALSADGSRVATLHEVPASVIVRRMSDGVILIDIPIPRGLASGGKVALSPDGRRLFYTGGVADAEIRIWDVDTARRTATIPWTRDRYTFAQKFGVSSDGRRVFASAIGEAHVWDIASGAPLMDDEAIGGDARDVVVTDKGAYVRGRTDVHVLTKDFESKASWFFTKDQTAWSIEAFLIAPDDSFAVLPTSGTELSIFRAADGALQHILRGHTAPILTAAISPDGHLVAALANDNTLRVWATATGKQAHVFKLAESGARRLSFSADSRSLMTFAGNSVLVWDVNAPSMLGRPTGLDPSWRVAKTDPSGSVALIDTAEKGSPSRFAVFDLNEGRVVANLSDRSPRIFDWDVAFSPAGSFVAFPRATIEVAAATDPARPVVGLLAPASHVVEVVSTRSGATVAQLAYDTSGNPTVAFSNDEKSACLLASMPSREHRSRLDLFALSDGRKILSVEQGGGEPRCIVAGRHALFLTEAEGISTVSGWDMADGHRLFMRGGIRSGGKSQARLVDEGRRLLLSSDDHPPALLDTATGTSATLFDNMLVGVKGFVPVGRGRGVLERSDGSWALWDFDKRAASDTVKGDARLRFDQASRDGGVVVLRDSRQEQDVVRAVEVATGNTLYEGPLTKLRRAEIVLSGDAQTLANQTDANRIELSRLRAHDALPAIATEGVLAKLILSEDGLYLTTLTTDGVWEIFDTTTGQRTFRLANGGSTDSRLFITGTGRAVVAGTLLSAGAMVVQAATGKVLWRTEDEIKRIVVSGDGTRLLAIHRERVVIRDLEDGRELRAFPCDMRKIFGAFPSPDGRHVAVVATLESGAASFVVDLKSASRFGEVTEADSIVFPETAAVFFALRKSSIETRDLAGGAVRATAAFQSPITRFHASPSGDTFLVQTEDRTIYVVDAVTGEKTLVTRLQLDAANVSFGATRNEILIHEASGVLSLWDVRARRRITSFAQEWSGASKLDWEVRTDPSETILAAITGDGWLRVVNIKTGAHVFDAPFADRYRQFVHLVVPDATTVVMLDGKGNLELVDLAKKQSRNIFRLGSSFSLLGTRLVAIGPDRLLATADDGTVFLVSRTLNSVDTLRSSTALPDPDAVLSKDGHFLAVTDKEGSLRLWDTSAHEIIEESTAFEDEKKSRDEHPFFSENGDYLILSGDHSADVVHLPPTRMGLLAKARQLAGGMIDPVPQLEKSRARLGVALREAQGSEVPAGQKGAILTDVVPDSPGFQAGLLPGDIVIDAGDKHVGGPQDVVQAVQAVGAGGALPLGVLRGGRKLSVVAHF